MSDRLTEIRWRQDRGRHIADVPRDMIEDIDFLLAKVTRLTALLKSVEWSAEGVTCPECEGGAYRFGHLSTCALYNAIKDLP